MMLPRSSTAGLRVDQGDMHVVAARQPAGQALRRGHPVYPAPRMRMSFIVLPSYLCRLANTRRMQRPDL